MKKAVLFSAISLIATNSFAGEIEKAERYESSLHSETHAVYSIAQSTTKQPELDNNATNLDYFQDASNAEVNELGGQISNISNAEINELGGQISTI